MRRRIVIKIFLCTLLISFSFSYVSAQEEELLIYRLPFVAGESWKLTQGYSGDGWVGSNPTHVKRDKFALDFSLPGETDYGKSILAIADGTAHVKESKKYDEKDGVYYLVGYGRYVEIEHGDGVISRYAHLKDFSIKEGDVVKQGQEIGKANSTGNSSGTHLHFAMYKENDEKVLEAYKPEPMSGYTEFTAGEWYTSDNELFDPNKPIVPAVVEAGEEPVDKPGFFSKLGSSIKSGFTKVTTGVKNFVVNIFSNDDKNIPATEPAPAAVSETTTETTAAPQTSTPVYNLEFIPASQTVEIIAGQTEQPITVKAKNTGNIAWDKQKYSVNVVGGTAAGAMYYHPSWITKLRPAILSESQVASGGVGTFSFTIKSPQTIGSYQFRLQVVRQEGTKFIRVGGETTINIVVKEFVAEPVPEPTKPTEPPQEKKVLGEKIKEVIENTVDQVVDTTKDVVKAIVDFPRRVFSGGRSDGGSSSGSSSAPAENIPEQNSAEAPLVELFYPTEMFTTTTVATTTLYGGKNEATNKVYLNENSDALTYPSSTAWQAEVNLAEGKNAFVIAGENEDGVKTENLAFEFFVDSLPPTVSALTADFQTGLIPKIAVGWSAEDSGTGVKNYDVEYRQDDGEWTALAIDTTSTEYFLEADILSTYNFRARAEDNLGNVSGWVENNDELFTQWPQTVVINELSWAGASAIKNPSTDCTRHEWLELFNNTAEAIDLNGWQVEILNANGTLLGAINLTSQIPAGEYYVLARQYGQKQALYDVEIDQLYSDRDLPDAGARLLLKNENGEIIDELDFADGWPEGTKTAGPVDNIYQAMGRIDSTSPGSYVDNWQTQNFITPFGKTGNCGKLYGTPSRDNVGMWYIQSPVYYYHDLIQNNILTFSPVNNPYVIGSEFTIPAGYTLQIDPGVVIIGEHPESFITIEGTLNISGTADEPAVFTSARDVTYGPFVLPSFLVGEPKPGDWSRINIKAGASVQINHAKFYYGAKSFKRTDGFFATKFLSHVLNITGGNVEIQNSDFVNSYTHANYPEYNAVVWIDNSGGATTTVRISDSLFDVGYTAVKANKIYNGTGVEVDLNNNTYQNFSSPLGPVDLSEL